MIDLLRTADGLSRQYEAPRIEGRPTHGTGCSLASAIATCLGHGLTLEHAVERARDYVRGAIGASLAIGRGRSPLDHGWARGLDLEPASRQEQTSSEIPMRTGGNNRGGPKGLPN